MALTITSTQPMSSENYNRYLWNENTPMTKTDNQGDAVLLDFALVPTDSDFVKLKRGSYVTVNTSKYPKWFTGYITNDPELEYLGTVGHPPVSPVWGYKYQATSDEFILSTKLIGLFLPFVNMTMGAILKKIISNILPTLPSHSPIFDVTNIDDGPLMAVYAADPTKKFSDIVKELSDSSCYVFWGRDHKLYFKPQNDVTYPSYTLDGSDTHFTPSRLTMTPSKDPIINDVTVLGRPEPQAYMTEYFVGTGMTGTYPLKAPVFGADTSVLITETFGSDTIDTTIWESFGLTGFELVTSNGYLNCTGGGIGYIWGLIPIALEGNIRLTHGEWDFVSETFDPSTQLSVGNGTGYIGGLWVNSEPEVTGAGLIYGLYFDGNYLWPWVDGAVDSTQAVYVRTDGTKRYILRTIANFSEQFRTPQPFAYVDPDGSVVNMTTTAVACQVTFSTVITQIDVGTGLKDGQWQFINTNGAVPADVLYAQYAPLMSIDTLNITVSNITVSVPIQASLDQLVTIPLVNPNFDLWDNTFTPTGWTYNNNCVQENSFIDVTVASSPSACMLVIADGNSVVGQNVAQLVQTDTQYSVTFSIAMSGVTAGNIYAGFDSASLNAAGTPLTDRLLFVTDLTTVTGAYTRITGNITSAKGLKKIPDDLFFMIVIVDGTGAPTGSVVWIDDIVVTNNTWKPLLLGANEIDAEDGQAPVATIVSTNSGAPTTNYLFGTSQYNPGTSSLQFFSDSVLQQSDVPPEGQILRLKYRAAGTAAGRVSDSDSIALEATNWGDDGRRSVVRSDLSPLPRTSAECEIAAAVIVAENKYQHYDGTYEQFSTYFENEPRAGAIFKFTNLDGMIPSLNAEQIQTVTTTLVDVNSTPETFDHVIKFGALSHLKEFLAEVGYEDNFQKQPTTMTNPLPVDLASVGMTYVDSVPSPELVSWTNTSITVDSGGVSQVEFRSTDRSWGLGDAKNLAGSGTSSTVVRSQRGRQITMRQVVVTVTP